MKRFLLLISLFSLISFYGEAQNFKGQWKGSFLDKSTTFVGWGGDRCDYVLELEVNGREVSGYSYTYFSDGGKKYYTICSLTGFVNKAEKYIEVKEIVRTKTNVPNTIRNCFQVHRLTYSKEDDTEMLQGTWVPAPNQDGDCGYGTTSLERRVLKKNYSLYSPATNKKTNPSNKNIPSLADKNKSKASAPIVKKAPGPVKKVTAPATKPVAKTTAKQPAKKPVKQDETALKPKTDIIQDTLQKNAIKTIVQDKITNPTPSFEKRNTNILKTIEVENVSVKVDLYDNGEIDGDSISLFYNNKLILSHKRLSDKPITLTINVEDDKSVNELVMYAENLGSIPPNTALMIVTDGPKRYEVRITSDLQKSGTIRFVHKPGVAAGN